MKNTFLVLLVLVISTHVYCQQIDTVYTKTDTIVGKITFMNNDNIFISVQAGKKNIENTIAFSDVVKVKVLSDAYIITNDSSLVKRIDVKPLSKKENSNLVKKTSVEEIQLNLFKCHKQYKTGTGLIIGGFCTTVAGVFIFAKGANSADTDLQLTGTIISSLGGGLVTAGWIVQVDSHKYLGFAGNGLTVGIKF